MFDFPALLMRCREIKRRWLIVRANQKGQRMAVWLCWVRLAHHRGREQQRGAGFRTRAGAARGWQAHAASTKKQTIEKVQPAIPWGSQRHTKKYIYHYRCEHIMRSPRTVQLAGLCGGRQGKQGAVPEDSIGPFSLHQEQLDASSTASRHLHSLICLK